MNPFAGKTTTERNKIIAALVLGVLALTSLFLAFGPSMSARKVTVTPQLAASPQTSGSPAPTGDFALPTKEEVDFDYGTTPIAYNGSGVYTPEPGRNIFAFYEPAPPCPGCTPTPTPKPTATPTPPPPPPMTVAVITPQNVYAGAGSFRLEVGGDKFDPAARIYFNQSEIPTNFVSPQKVTADIPAGLIASEGPKQIIVQTPDGKLYSNPVVLNVQPPPTPQFQYIGMIARKRYNNDTAYFLEPGKQIPFGARLNDVVAGRFRVISISSSETVLEDTALGFKHKLALVPASAGTSNSPPGRRNDFPTDSTFPSYNPSMPSAIPQNVPGIPNNVPRYVPPQPRPQQTPPEKKDADDDDDDGDGNN
jgi:hypothetical protein